MTASADAFLDAAEDVLTDWTGSPDAARWRPPVHRPAPPTDEQIRAAIAAWPTVAESLRTTFAALADVAASVVRSLAPLAELADSYALAPPALADPVDPRAHALAYRRARGTGPALPLLDGRHR